MTEEKLTQKDDFLDTTFGKQSYKHCLVLLFKWLSHACTHTQVQQSKSCNNSFLSKNIQVPCLLVSMCLVFFQLLSVCLLSLPSNETCCIYSSDGIKQKANTQDLSVKSSYSKDQPDSQTVPTLMQHRSFILINIESTIKREQFHPSIFKIRFWVGTRRKSQF